MVEKFSVRGQLSNKNTDGRQRFGFARRFPSDLDSTSYADLLVDKDSDW